MEKKELSQDGLLVRLLAVLRLDPLRRFRPQWLAELMVALVTSLHSLKDAMRIQGLLQDNAKGSNAGQADVELYNFWLPRRWPDTIAVMKYRGSSSD